MNYQVTKLDKRHSGYGFYKYSISPLVRTMPESVEALKILRNWCWATWGPSSELGWTYRGDKWAWDTEYKKKRIFLNSDEELTLFNLKFVG